VKLRHGPSLNTAKHRDFSQVLLVITVFPLLGTTSPC